MIDLNYIDYHRVGEKDKCETWAYEYNHKGQCQRTRHKTKERERKNKFCESYCVNHIKKAMLSSAEG